MDPSHLPYLHVPDFGDRGTQGPNSSSNTIPWAVLDPWSVNMDDKTDDATKASSTAGAINSTIDPPLCPETKTRSVPPNIWRAAVDTNFNLPAEGIRIGRHVMTFADFGCARNADLFMVHAVEFELNQGDTLVYVDVPNMPKDPRKVADCDNIAYRSQAFRVHSEKLRATGSTKFAEMLGPTYQFRIQRRRKMVNKLPDGVKYLLDLTPPAEGDELVFQMTETSLTPGIMDWWTSYRYHGAEIGLVAGHDDICCCKRQMSDYTGFGPDEDERFDKDGCRLPKPLGTAAALPPLPVEMVRYKEEGREKLHETPEYRKIPDYCPIRHRNSIIRLMIMLEGREIPLDSANRVWMLVAVAKILDCTSVVRDRVAQWIMQDRNCRFIEVLPEEALKIGYDLHLQDVTQTAFRILVNEMALQEAATGHGSAPKRARPRTTIFGRRTGECSDELNNIIQHAARALVERVTVTHTELQSEDLFDRWGIGEWGKLRKLEAVLVEHCSSGTAESTAFSDALNKVRLLMTQLRRTIGLKYSISAESYVTSSPFLNGMDTDRATYVNVADWEELENIMGGFNAVQKLLCPFVYYEMGDRCNKSFFTNPYPDASHLGDQSLTALAGAAQSSLEVLLGRFPRLADAQQWRCIIDDTVPPSAPSFNRIQRPFVDLHEMETQVKHALQPLTLCWVRHDVEPPANITRHLLLTLHRDEMKYLPLWAGGLDDGTGGVFEEHIPPTDMGPNGPGPAYHTGRTIPSAPPSISSSLMEEIAALKMDGLTSGGSVDVHDSISTVYRADRVIAEDVSVASESFKTEPSDYQAARFAIPQDHQSMGEAVNALVETDEDFDMDMQETPQASDGESDSDDSVVVIKAATKT
ncbi:hypothetical protein QQS21_003483 [Conoideocrella luteorostrata]|uniref:Uncharacterized protein n=1 Tax=Conoideocrella luteorostrata TaxID=1105319 RepID=A0AAJ0CW71_9HYPO|nr:hypothetical protein QQS21_003483 [Conoideocrella luteorostrata]